jgi:hypothetical protein
MPRQAIVAADAAFLINGGDEGEDHSDWEVQ